MTINLTASALAKITDLLAEENNPNLKLRVFIQGGGCSGFQYGFQFDEDLPAEDDFSLEFGHITVLVDASSMTYLQGAEIDYTESFMESKFVVNNPNATSTCGCGSSFSA